jgi:hypothetical protein
MKNTMLTRLAGAACLVGGLIFLFDFTVIGWVLKMDFLSSVKPAANLTRDFVWCVGAIGLTGDAVGLNLVGATGNGWQRFLPLLSGLCFPFKLPLQMIFFLGQGKGPNVFLPGIRGIPWALLGAVIWTNISKTESFEFGLEKA